MRVHDLNQCHNSLTAVLCSVAKKMPSLMDGSEWMVVVLISLLCQGK